MEWVRVGEKTGKGGGLGAPAHQSVAHGVGERVGGKNGKGTDGWALPHIHSAHILVWSFRPPLQARNNEPDEGER